MDAHPHHTTALLACDPGFQPRADTAFRVEALLDLLDVVEQPFDLAVVVVAEDGATRTGLVVRGPDGASTAAAAAHVAAMARAVELPLELLDGPSGLLGPMTVEEAYVFEPADGLPPSVVWQRSVFLAAAATSSLEGTWRLVLDLGTPIDEGRRRCGASLAGQGSTGPALAALVAREVGVRSPLRFRPARGEHLVHVAALQEEATAPLLCVLDPGELARAVALTVQPTAAQVTGDELVDRLAAANPPHVWVSGSSGTGKTTLLERLLAADLDAGRRVVVLDPHGDLVARAASVLDGRGAAADVHDLDGPVAWNVAQAEEGMTSAAWSGELAAVVRDLWPTASEDVFGPVWHRGMRAALRVLVEDPEGPWPLTRLPELFLDGDLLDDALERIADPTLTATWDLELRPRLKERDAGSFLNWLLAKIDPLVGDPMLASTIGSTELDVRFLTGRNVLVHLPVGSLGPDGSRFLAGVALAQLWAGARRGALGDVAVYVDEWQRAAAPSLARVLSEGRKYGIRLRLANQHSGQLRRELLEAVDANAGGIVTFRAGRIDAEMLVSSLDGVEPAELRALPDHQVVSLLGGSIVRARTLPPLSTDPGAFGRMALATAHRCTILDRLATTLGSPS